MGLFGGMPVVKLTDAAVLFGLTVTGALTVPASADCSGLYVLEGAGTLSAGGKAAPLKKTDQLFVPCAVGAFTLKADPDAPLRVLHFFGPCTE